MAEQCSKCGHALADHVAPMGCMCWVGQGKCKCSDVHVVPRYIFRDTEGKPLTKKDLKDTDWAKGVDAENER